MWPVGKQAHASRRDIQTMQIKLRPGGGAAAEAKLVTDNGDRRSAGKAFYEIARDRDRRKSGALPQ
jgi:hypothetical protein